MVCDCIDFKTYTVKQVTRNHDNHHAMKKCTGIVCDHIDLKYTKHG